MLRTSLRTVLVAVPRQAEEFLSSNAQDFIEEQLNIQLDVWQSFIPEQ